MGNIIKVPKTALEEIRKLQLHKRNCIVGDTVRNMLVDVTRRRQQHHIATASAQHASDIISNVPVVLMRKHLQPDIATASSQNASDIVSNR